MKFPLPSNDPLGTDLKLNANGDLDISVFGSFDTVSGADNAGQSVRVDITTNPDLYLWSEDVGTFLASYVDDIITPEKEKQIQNIVIDRLSKNPRIIKVQEVSLDDSTNNQLIITANALVEGVGEVQIPIRVGGV